MSAQQVCLLFVLFYVSFSQTEQLFVSVEVPYNGVESTCQSCTAGNSQPVPSMACRSDNSTWNNGIRPFVDPIPAGYIAKSINVTFLGSFGCSNYTGSDGLVTIDGTLVNIIRNVSATEDCACDGCMQEIFVSGHYINGWPRYIYGGNNTLRIAANASLCVASANVSIEYSSPTPVFNSYHPLLIPVNKTENITIIGKNFLSSMQLRCSFGGFWLTNTTYVGSTQLVCPAPAFPFVNTTEFQVIDDTGTPLLSGTFGWYKEPEILSFDPPNGASNIAVNVSLIGTGFFNSSAMSCKFGEVPILTVEYVNETMVICNDVSGKIYSNATNVTVAFSENQEDFVYAAEEYLFTGIAIPPESTSATPSITPSTQSDGLVPAAYAGIALAVLLLCLFCMGSTVLILQRNKSKNFEKSAGYIQYDEESNLLQDPTEDSDKGEGNISMSEITRMKQIEKGSFGVIYEAQWRGTKIAVKKLPPTMTDKLKNEFLQEAALMKSLRHPNILQYLGVATKGNEMCICMEFMPRGSLYRILHNSKSEFSRDKIKSICLDTVRGMNYLHHQNPPVIHRDLKSHNLLVDRHWQVKVCDFGLSRITAQNQTMTACGTPSWTAPEVLRNERYTTKADVYGFGVVVWELFSRSDPFPGMPPFQIVFAVGTQKLRPTIQPDWPLEWVDLISSCWNENPEARPSFAELIPILEDMNEAN